MAKKLTKKQQLFADEYLVDLNQTRAYIAAGYSEKGAAQSASALLRNPNVAAYIAKKSEKITTKLELSAEKVIAGLSRLATYDVRQFFDADGNIKTIPTLSDAEAAAITGFEVVDVTSEDGPKTFLKKFRLADRGQNLERLGRYHKLFTEKVEHEVVFKGMTDEERAAKIAAILSAAKKRKNGN